MTEPAWARADALTEAFRALADELYADYLRSGWQYDEAAKTALSIADRIRRILEET